MKRKGFLRFGLYSAAAAIMLTQSCYAYIDPAATSYILAIVSGVVVAVGTAFGIVFNKLKRKVKKKNTEEEAGELAPIYNPEESKGENVVITADDLLNDDDNDDKKTDK